MNTFKYYLSLTITVALFTSAFGFSVGACDTDELNSVRPELPVESSERDQVLYVPSFDLGGELVQEEWFDLDENPIVGPDGWHRVDYIRDPRGLVTEEVGYNAESLPATSAVLGYATVVFEYDEHGRETYAGYFDAEDQPIAVTREISDGSFHDPQMLEIAFQSVETHYFDDTLLERSYDNELGEAVHFELVDLLAWADEADGVFEWCGRYANILFEEDLEPGAEAQFAETALCGCEEDPEDTDAELDRATSEPQVDLADPQEDEEDEAENSPCDYIDFVEPWDPSDSALGESFVPVEKVPTLDCDEEESDRVQGPQAQELPSCVWRVRGERAGGYGTLYRDCNDVYPEGPTEDDMDCDDEENCFEGLDCDEDQESCFEEPDCDEAREGCGDSHPDEEIAECGSEGCSDEPTHEQHDAANLFDRGTKEALVQGSPFESAREPIKDAESSDAESLTTTDEANPLLQPEGWTQEEDLESDAWMEEEDLDDTSWVHEAPHDDPNEPGC